MKPAWSLLLAPGAGADRNQAALVALDEVASRAAANVTRMDFPYRKAGRRNPDRPPVLLRAVLDEVASLPGPGPLVLGGRSMGGRICSLAAAEGLGPDALAVAGLLLVSYPLHPPGRPDKLRIEHFPAIEVPCLFVSGTRDAFATPSELEEHTGAIPGPVTHHWIDGKDHALRNADDEVGEAAQAWLDGLGLTLAAGPAG
ncbi:MAG: dienelactone hydrolase [Actinomycetota bacterium]|nr:dienelactone hydrolase [Actinomycetota bacterium]